MEADHAGGKQRAAAVTLVVCGDRASRPARAACRVRVVENMRGKFWEVLDFGLGVLNFLLELKKTRLTCSELEIVGTSKEQRLCSF